MELVLLGIAALMIFGFAFLAGWETKSWWAVLWPLTVPAVLFLVGAAAHLLGDQSDCLEGCEFVFVLVVPALTGAPALVWVAGATAARLARAAL